MNDTFPTIGVVIIGINVENYLADCIQSILSAQYPQDLLQIIYVDGGSSDRSPQIAKGFTDIRTIELNDRHPTPGRGRNKGWMSLSTPIIQFMDADTILDPMWFKNAVLALKDYIVAVCGHRRERFPDRNIYHLLTDMEWHYEVGPCRYFGGEVLIKRHVLEQTQGFDEDLVAGEDPELSYRIRQLGWQIVRIDAAMTTHDINMTSFQQYWKRAFRSGHAYAEIGTRFLKNKEKLWLKEFIRVLFKALVPVITILVGILVGYAWLGIALGLFILCRPFFHLRRLKRTYRTTWKKVLLYVCHSVIVVYPQFLGVLRYFLSRINGKPLLNKGVNE